MSETYVEIESLTWHKDTHGLFDYDSTSYTTNKFLVSSSGNLCRSNGSISFLSHLPLQTSGPEEFLLSIKRKSDRFLITSLTDSAPELWKAIKYSTTNDGHILNEGDELKLGRIRLKVTKISKGAEESFNPLTDRLLVEDMSERDKESTCRICCCEEEDTEDPLITPCKCIGSVRFIHLRCIKKWLESKINCRSTSKVLTYNWSDLSCELCKTILPHSIKHNGKTLELISITFPKGPHIVLEEQKEEGQKTLFMIDLSSNSAVIGRGHDCDIRLTDISVSRKHSKFFMQNGRCLVKDLSSKFGTLLFTQKEIMLEKERVVGIQIGRNLFKFKCKVKSKCWVYCCESDSPTARANPPETDPHSPISFRTK